MLSALDFYWNAQNTENKYVKFILLVITAERLFTKNDNEAKWRRLAEGMRRYTREADFDGVHRDYDIRNDLVHGPATLPPPSKDEVRELARKWSAWCAEVLRKKLTETTSR